MLSRLFQGIKRIEHPDPAVRLKALSELEDPNSRSAQEILSQAARSDKDLSVREAAIAKLNSAELLGELLTGKKEEGEDGECVRQASANRLAGLIQAGSKNGFQAHPAVLKARVRQAAPAEVVLILQDTTDADLLIELVLNNRGEVREEILLHPAFDSHGVLADLEKQSRDRDKSLNRFARERLDAIKQLRLTSAQAVTRLAELLHALNNHLNQDIAGSGFWDKFKSLENAARECLVSLESNHQALKRHAEAVTELIELRTGFAEIQTTAEILRPATRATPEPTDPLEQADPFESLTVEFESLDGDLAANTDFDALCETRQRLTDAWLAAADQQPPSAAQHSVFEQVSHRFHELSRAVERTGAATALTADLAPLPNSLTAQGSGADRLWRDVAAQRKVLREAREAVRHIAWPAWATAATAYSQLPSDLDAIEAAIDRLDEQAGQLLDKIAAEIQKLSTELDDGSSKTAQPMVGQIRQQLRALPQETTTKLNKRLNHQANRLAELKDWQSFATTPKRDALCAALSELIEKPLAPADQAHRIKQLREQWNGLGALNRAKDRRLAEHFNHLAERAFKPCRSHFAEQAAARKVNLQARVQICDQLKSYLDATDWHTAEIKAAEQILRTARAEWRKYHPVDRDPGKSLESQFESLQGSLHEKITTAWDSNLSLKKAIVEEAGALATSGLLIEEQIAAAKSLQRRWRDVGPTPRRPDQALWGQFRASCDAIFAAREQHKKDADEAINAAHHTVAAALDEMAAILSGPAEATRDSLRQMHTTFKALEKLPERLQRPLDQRFSKIEQAYQARLKTQKASNALARLKSLEDFDQVLATREVAHRAGATMSRELPDPIFEGRWEDVDAPVPTATLTRLTVEAEVAAGLESTAADKNIRLAVQVDLLNSAKGGTRKTADTRTLLEQWCQTGPKDQSIDELRVRFFRAIVVQKGL
jgi:hypothetical protein